MADIIPNECLGYARSLIQNVEDDSPAAATIDIIAWVAGAGATDALITDMAGKTVSVLDAITDMAQASNTGYSRIQMTDADITILVDDTNDRTDITFTDKTFTSVDAGDNWTDITLNYNASGADTDAVLQVLHLLDFVVTPNGGDITVDFPAVSFRVSQV